MAGTQSPAPIIPTPSGSWGTSFLPWSLGSRNFWTWFSNVKQWGQKYLPGENNNKFWSFVTISVPSSALAKGGAVRIGQRAGPSPLTPQPPRPRSEAWSTHVCVAHAAFCPATFGRRVVLCLSIAPEVFVEGSIQTIYGQYIATVYNICVFSFFSPVCPSPDLELNEPTSSTLLQGQYPPLLYGFSLSPSPSPSPLLPSPAPLCVT